MLAVDFLECVRQVLERRFPTWRVVVVLPEGDEPDVVVYKDCIKIGDRPSYSQTTFETMKQNWIEGEQWALAPRSEQILLLSDVYPDLFLSSQRDIFLLKSFGWGYCSPSDEREFGVWFGCVGKNEGDPSPHTINSLRIGSKEYPDHSLALYGRLNSVGKWRFAGTARCTGTCVTLPFRRFHQARSLV